MKTEKYALTALCILALGWVAKMLVGIIGLAGHQEVPWVAASFEMIMFLGAASIPLIAVWITRTGKHIVLILAWLPCLLYVAFLAVLVATSDPFSGGIRILLWLAIAVLFTHVSRNQGKSIQLVQTRTTSGPV